MNSLERENWLRERKSRIESMYNSFMTQEEIGKELGVHQRTIFYFMKKNGIKARVAAKRDQIGNKNQYWKGDKISYKGAHQRVRRDRGNPKKCIKCNTIDGKIEWASISKQHCDPNDYQAMCVPCHRKHDMNLRTEQIKKNCPICSEGWFVVPSKAKQIYCSQQCSGKMKSAKLDHEHVIELYKSGFSQKQIADKYKLSRKPIARLLKKYNIKQRYKNSKKELYNEQKQRAVA